MNTAALKQENFEKATVSNTYNDNGRTFQELIEELLKQHICK